MKITNIAKTIIVSFLSVGSLSWGAVSFETVVNLAQSDLDAIYNANAGPSTFSLPSAGTTAYCTANPVAKDAPPSKTCLVMQTFGVSRSLGRKFNITAKVTLQQSDLNNIESLLQSVQSPNTINITTSVGTVDCSRTTDNAPWSCVVPSIQPERRK